MKEKKKYSYIGFDCHFPIYIYIHIGNVRHSHNEIFSYCLCRVLPLFREEDHGKSRLDRIKSENGRVKRKSVILLQRDRGLIVSPKFGFLIPPVMVITPANLKACKGSNRSILKKLNRIEILTVNREAGWKIIKLF